MTIDKFQKAVDDAITNCIRNDCAFGSYAHKVTKAVWPLLEAAEKERDALRAKIKQMEQQEPVAWCATDETGTVVEALGMNQSRRFDTALYLSHGAQPAPSVPTALLVAVANLGAQMEIVSRVGFVDTPNDKDSCAAFCVAQGTWLELMSAVESLASALAAAPEARP